jgi:hypothetical protein
MANPHLSTTLARFEAQVHDTKNRLVSIPAAVQRSLRLARRRNNHIVFYSIRPKGRGRWNHHLAYLTYDNEFAISSSVTNITSGEPVEVKIHRVIPDADALSRASANNAASVLLELSGEAGEDEREDGSTRVDDYLSDLVDRG